MASTINASTTGTGGIITTADNTGNIAFQSGDTTVFEMTSAGIAVTGRAYSPTITLTDGASISWDTASGQVATVTLGGNRTFNAPTNLQDGAFYSLEIIQDGTGSRTASWNSVFKFTGATAPTLTTTASAKDYIVFRSDGTNLYEQGRSLGVA